MTKLLRLVRLFRRQDGISLVMAVGVLGVLSMSGATLVQYANSNNRSSEYSKDNSDAYGLAEAGIHEALGVVFEKKNNPLNPYLLPSTTSTYDGGSVTWSGTLNQNSNPAKWTITSASTVRNPTGAGDIRRALTIQVRVTPTNTQPLGNNGWNYIMSTGTSEACDLHLVNNAIIGSPLYAAGDLCLDNTAKITGGPLLAHGQLVLKNALNTVGTSAAPINKAHVKAGCQYKNNPIHSPCSSADNVFASEIGTAPETIDFPVADWEAWYLESSPGPHFPCVTVTGTPPAFDNDAAAPTAPKSEKLAKRNRSVPGTFHLTPPSSYTCRTPGGELSWNAGAKKLTVSGTVYIDGNAYVGNGLTNSYDGHATIYLSGSLLLKGSQLCAIASGSTCDWTTWNPNNELLVFVAGDKGGGGQTDVNADTSIEVKSAHFQGGLYAAQKVNFSTAAGDPQMQGPILAPKIVIAQSITTYSWPAITIAPVGLPGNEVVFGDPQPPENFG